MATTLPREFVLNDTWTEITVAESNLLDIQNTSGIRIQWSYVNTIEKGLNLYVGEILRDIHQTVYFKVDNAHQVGTISIVEKDLLSNSNIIRGIDARSGLIDAFNRLRVSTATKIFDAQLQYDMQPIFWDTKIIGNATETHDTLNSAADLSVLGEGDKIIRQTKEYYRYQAGDSQAIKMTYTPDAHSDDYYVVRSSTSGSAIDNRVHQNNPLKSKDGVSVWNIDKLDGTGESGIEIDHDKSQILFIDLEWLSVGTVAFGIFVDRKLQYGHMAHHANKVYGAYMTTANLPLRYEIEILDGDLIQRVGYFDDKNGVFYEMISPNVTSGTLKEICNSIESEGGIEEETGIPFSVGTRANPVILASGATVYMGARHSLLYNSIENRAKFIPKAYRVASTDERLTVRVVYNPVITGGTWNPYSENGYDSIMEVSTDITSISGGLTIDDEDVYAASPANKSSPAGSRNEISSKLPFGIGIDGDTPIPLVLEITNLGTGSTTISYGTKWIEVR